MGDVLGVFREIYHRYILGWDNVRNKNLIGRVAGNNHVISVSSDPVKYPYLVGLQKALHVVYLSRTYTEYLEQYHHIPQDSLEQVILYLLSRYKIETK